MGHIASQVANHDVLDEKEMSRLVPGPVLWVLMQVEPDCTADRVFEGNDSGGASEIRGFAHHANQNRGVLFIMRQQQLQNFWRHDIQSATLDVLRQGVQFTGPLCAGFFVEAE